MTCSKNKILITEFNSNYSSEAIRNYNSVGSVLYYDDTIKNFDEINTLVVGLNIQLDQSFLKKFENLKYIITNTTGLNHIDLNYCKKEKIEIISLKGETSFLESINATPDFTVTLVLSLVRKITYSFIDFRNKKKCNRLEYISHEFSDLTVGVAGCGRVGVKVAKKLKSLGFKVNGFDPYKNQKYFKKNNITKINSIDDFLKNIDVLVISISYSDENINFFDKQKLNILKKGAIVINTARGEVLDENDLLDLLDSNHISSAGLDVTSIENINNPLLEKRIKKYCSNNNNLIITPHIAGATFGSMKSTQEFVSKKFISML